MLAVLVRRKPSRLPTGEDVARAEPAIVDGEPGSRGRGPPGNADRPTEEMSERHDHG